MMMYDVYAAWQQSPDPGQDIAVRQMLCSMPSALEAATLRIAVSIESLSNRYEGIEELLYVL
jgi:hypothetical protein